MISIKVLSGLFSVSSVQLRWYDLGVHRWAGSFSLLGGGIDLGSGGDSRALRYRNDPAVAIFGGEQQV